MAKFKKKKFKILMLQYFKKKKPAILRKITGNWLSSSDDELSVFCLRFFESLEFLTNGEFVWNF